MNTLKYHSFLSDKNIKVSQQEDKEAYVFGKGFTNPTVAFRWNPDGKEAVNPHILICGLSGAGKSTLIKSLVRYLQDRNKHIYVIDLHGDMGVEGENYVEFTAWNSQYGINPFEFDTGVDKETLEKLINGEIEPDEKVNSILKNSGPIVQVREIVEIIKKNFLPNMGQNQENVFKWLLLDSYIYKNIQFDNFKTWNKELPNFEDTKFIINEIFDIWNRIVSALKDAKIKAYSKVIISDFYESIFEKEPNELEIKGIDVLKYLDSEIIKTVKRIDFFITSFIESQVFHSKLPPVRAGLNRFDVSGLRHEIQRFVSDIVVGKVFRACKLRGEYNKLPNKARGEKCDTFIVLDEARLVVPNGKNKNDPFAYLNRIVTESRKYGLGLIVAVQSPSHLPDEFLRNIYMQVILNTNQSDYNTAKKVFDLTDRELLKHTKTFGVALVRQKFGFQSVKLECCEGLF